MLSDSDRLSLFLGLESADATLPTPFKLSQRLEPLCYANGLGLAVALGVIVNAEGAGQEVEAHVPRQCRRT